MDHSGKPVAVSMDWLGPAQLMLITSLRVKNVHRAKVNTTQHNTVLYLLGYSNCRTFNTLATGFASSLHHFL